VKKAYIHIIDILFLTLAIVSIIISLFDFFPLILSISTFILGITIVFCLPVIPKGPKFYSLGMLLIGSFLLFQNGSNLKVWEQAINSNMDLLTLFILVPLLSLPIRYGSYIEVINLIFRGLGGVKWKIHAFSSLLVALLAPILTLGAVTMIKDLSPQFSNEKTFLVSLSRIFGLTLFWTPYFGTVIFILSLLNLEWGEIVPFTFAFAIFGLIVSILFERIINKGMQVDEFKDLDNSPLPPGDRKKIIELIIIILSLLLLTLAIYYGTNLNMAISISLVSMVTPIIWLHYLKKINRLKDSLRYYFQNLLPKLKGEIVLILSASFFGFAFVNSRYSTLVPRIFSEITQNNSFVFILLLSFIMIFISVIGVHPFVLTTIFAATLSNGGIPISQIVLAFVILCSWGMALTLSPFSATTLVVARDTLYSPYRVSVVWNIGYIGLLYLFLVITGYSLVILGF
jgi:hypothetical protein